MAAFVVGALDNPVDLLLLLVVAVLIFGKQLPEVARSVGKGIRELRESANFSDMTDALNSVNEVRSAISPAGLLRAALPDDPPVSDLSTGSPAAAPAEEGASSAVWTAPSEKPAVDAPPQTDTSADQA